jgi:hypothetical protein
MGIPLSESERKWDRSGPRLGGFGALPGAAIVAAKHRRASREVMAAVRRPAPGWRCRRQRSVPSDKEPTPSRRKGMFDMALFQD